MITCPWCGTQYAMFQPNCKNCGGALQAEAIIPPAPDAELPMPPAAPRTIAGSYILRLLFTDAGWIAACILVFMGLLFSLLGAALSLDGSTSFVGIPFLLIGLAMLGLSGTLFWKRYHHARQVIDILRAGEPTSGNITELRLNYSLTINGMHPWIIGYTYSVNGQAYTGKVSTMIPPGPQLQQGKAVRILYLADDPQAGTLYPHP